MAEYAIVVGKYSGIQNHGRAKDSAALITFNAHLTTNMQMGSQTPSLHDATDSMPVICRDSTRNLDSTPILLVVFTCRGHTDDFERPIES
ncbi:hypothetical protein ACTXT7_016096 [Hymenolepis weldensis]